MAAEEPSDGSRQRLDISANSPTTRLVPVVRHGLQRQAESERRVHAQLALHPDPAPAQLDELSAEREPEPGPLHLLRGRPHLPKLLEHRFLDLWGDANAGVAH